MRSISRLQGGSVTESHSPNDEQTGGQPKWFRSEFWDYQAINAKMALRYSTFDDDEQLSLDYDGNLETAVALREEEVHEADLSTGILEATSAAMRSLLTVFGEYSIHPAGIRALQLKLKC